MARGRRKQTRRSIVAFNAMMGAENVTGEQIAEFIEDGTLPGASPHDDQNCDDEELRMIDRFWHEEFEARQAALRESRGE